MLGIRMEMPAYLDRLRAELGRLDPAPVVRLGDRIHQAWQQRRFVFLFGNGGSATTASHLAEDLGKNCLSDAALDPTAPHAPRRLKILSLTDNVGWITALGNDLGYDQIFVQQLMHYAEPGDVAIAISGSGNSPNVLAAVDWANRAGLWTFGMTGYEGGRLKAVQQDGLHVALDDMAMVETVHVAVGHWLVDDLSARINRQGRYG